MSTTIYDIAKKAKVHPSTVSLVFKDSPSIPDKTKQRIKRIADKLQYRPNFIARSLANGKTNTIGLIVPDIKNPLVSEFTQAIQTYAHSLGYGVILSITDNDIEIEKEYIDILQNRGVDGILINHPVRSSGKEYIQKLVNEKFPVVLIGEIKGLKTDFVMIDIVKGVFLVISHLIELGHKRIIFMKGQTRYYRVEGYKKALKYYNIPLDEQLIIEHSHRLEDLPEVVDKILPLLPKKGGHCEAYSSVIAMSEARKQSQVVGHSNPALVAIRAEEESRLSRPTAIFGFNDYLAVGLVALLEEKGIKVPVDIAVVGFDNIELSKYAKVPLTTVDLKTEQIAKASVDLLIKKINNTSLGPKKMSLRGTLATKQSHNEIEKIVLEPELIIRKSCGCNGKHS